MAARIAAALSEAVGARFLAGLFSGPSSQGRLEGAVEGLGVGVGQGGAGGEGDKDHPSRLIGQNPCPEKQHTSNSWNTPDAIRRTTATHCARSLLALSLGFLGGFQ